MKAIEPAKGKAGFICRIRLIFNLIVVADCGIMLLLSYRILCI